MVLVQNDPLIMSAKANQKQNCYMNVKSESFTMVFWLAPFEKWQLQYLIICWRDSAQNLQSISITKSVRHCELGLLLTQILLFQMNNVLRMLISLYLQAILSSLLPKSSPISYLLYGVFCSLDDYFYFIQLQNSKFQISGIIYVILIHLTQQMLKDNRRECIMYDECALFTIFEKTNKNIIEKSEKATQFICNQGIRALKNIAMQYIRNKNKSQTSEYTFQNYQRFDQDKPIINKKELISQSSETSFTQTKKYPSFHIKSEGKFRENSFMPAKKKRLTQAEQLRQSLKKLRIEEKDFSNEQESQENIDNINLQQFKNKSLEELIQQSNKKIQEKKAIQNKKQKQSESSDSSYSLTDYSSNQSSNQFEHEEQFRIQNSFRELPVRSSFPSFSQSSIGSCNYLPSKICNSPIKSKSYKKRLFIRNKKIPKWAQDMQKVKQITYNQRNNPQQFDYKKIYGLCYVQKLDSNIIFNIQTTYNRGSSAKWNRYPYNQFIE